MLSKEQEEALYGMVNDVGMSVGEATIVLMLAEVRRSLERLVELAEGEQAEYVEDAEPVTDLAGRRIG